MTLRPLGYEHASSASFSMARSPIGIASVSAEAFGAQCSKIGGSEPLFVTEAPVSVRIDAKDIAQVLLKLIRNGRLSVGVDFEKVIKNVAVWDRTIPGYKPAAMGVAFSRFCSADLAPLSAFWDATSSTGYNGRLLLNGEETGAEGRAFAHGMDGTSWELPRLGKTSWENAVAAPASGLKTVVVGTDDSTPGQVYVYAGTKTNVGAAHDRAGLTNGALFGVKVTGIANEEAATGIAGVAPFTLANLGNVENKTGAQNDVDSVAAGVTTFNRPEDGAWDPSSPNDFYFVTTASFSGPSRLWRLRFADVKNPELGGTVEMMLDGTEGQKMMDNITLDKFGHVYIQEDVGSQDHLGRIARYDINGDKLTFIAQHDPAKFAPGGAEFLTRDEEASGMIDASDILGQGWFLLDDQAHYATDVETVEGGQMLVLFDPASKP